MKRRSYLALASTACLAGCIGADPSEREPGNGDTGRNGGDGPTATPASTVITPGTLDDFEDVGNWSIAGGAATLDTEHSYVGSQSVRVDTDPTENHTILSKTFEDPIDVSNVVPGVAMRTDAETVVPWLRLKDVDGNRLDFRRAIGGDLPFMRYNFGVDDVEGDVDLTAIEDVVLQLWTAEGVERSIWFDDLHFVPRPETGKVMIQFDDAHETDHSVALPILEEYGYPAVTFIVPGYLDHDEIAGYPRLTTDEVYDLHDAGWTISNHTKTHPRLSELDEDEQDAEIRSGKAWLLEHGFEAGARYFAYPFGDYDATTLELVDEHHEIGFAGGFPAQGHTANHLLTSRIGEPTPEESARAVELAAEMRGITQMFFHRLDGELLDHFEAMVETIHEYESAGEIDLILPQDVEAEFVF